MKISKNFTLAEMTVSQTAVRKGIDNTPDSATIENLKRLCATLEKVRTAAGKPIVVSSGYRCQLLNDSITGEPNKKSQHILGCAADIKAIGLSPDELMRIIITAGIEFDQLILEFDSWVHISVPNKSGSAWRMQSLVIDKKGTRNYVMYVPLKGKKPKPLRKSRTISNASIAATVGTIGLVAPAIEPAGQVAEIMQNNAQGVITMLLVALIVFGAIAFYLRYSDRHKL